MDIYHVAAPIPIEIQDRLNDLAANYAKYLYDRAMAILSQFKARGVLVDSLHVMWFKATDTEGPFIRLFYEEHGEYLNKRKMLWTKQPPVEELEEWAEGRNVIPSYLPGYSTSAFARMSNAYKRNRFAWAIAINKKNNDTWKSKQWKKKTLVQLLKDLNKEIITAYQQEAEKIIAESLTNAA